MTLNHPEELSELLGVRFSREQLEAICAPLAPQVIIAGAGTGKTTVMAARVVWLVGTGQVTAEQVLGLTFTRKAAAELGARVGRALDQAGLFTDDDTQGSELVLTYDAFAGRLVRDFGLRLGLDGEMQLLSGAARYQIATKAVAQHEQVLSNLARLSHHTLPERLLALDGVMASHLVSPEDLRQFTRGAEARFAEAPRYRGRVLKIIEETQSALAERLELLALVEEYRRLKTALGVTEFADQQAHAVALARGFPAVGAALRERFHVVLLDEYQDTSAAQALLLRALFSGSTPQRGRGHPVTAVGDPNQAIYAWRGAAASNIAGFPKHFSRAAGEAARRYELTINRRSGSRILAAGNALVAALALASGDGVALQAPSDAPSGEVIAREFDSLDEELLALGSDIVRRHAEGTAWGNMAVLTRRNDLLAATYDVLRSRDVPVEIVGLGGMLYLPEIAPVVATLKLLVNPVDNAAAASLLTGPRWGLSLEDLVALARRARDLVRTETEDAQPEPAQAQPGLGDALSALLRRSDTSQAPSLLDAAADPGEGYLPEPGKDLVQRFARELAELRSHLGEPVGDVVRRVIAKLGLTTEVMIDGDPAQLTRFTELCSSFPTLGQDSDLSALLAWLEAEKEHGVGLERATSNHADSVKLLTVHRAKGLEWDAVYLPALAEGVFPSPGRDGNWTTNASQLPAPLRGDADSVPQLGEYTKPGIEAYKALLQTEQQLSEDRLAYVAATRAKRTLVVSTHTWARGLKRPRTASRYFQAIASLADEWQPSSPPPENPHPDAGRTAVWPRPYSHREAARAEATELVREAQKLIATGGDETEWVWRSGVTDEAIHQRIDAWDRDIAFLIEQLSRRASRQLVLPPGLSASALMELGRDPDGFATKLLRQMPRQPRRDVRLGEQFHDWVVTRFGASPGFDELSPRQTDDPALRRLQEAFEASPFAQRMPLGVEVPFLLKWRHLVLRGRIDAVFPSDDPHYDALVVDWKIGNQDPDPLQLAIYRLAWAEARGLDLQRVAVAFHHVLANRLEHVAAGPELIEAAASQLGGFSNP
ncbi:MAG: ATP-dependent DNA helicase [Propionibacteriaceae bacterium]|nr:ATP-dependent DNA helicase [Propionibacteriaceae bacterium]